MRRVVVLDHHKTAIDHLLDPDTRLPGNVDMQHLDLNRSGATIARDFFKPALTPDLEMMFRLEFHDGPVGERT